MPRNNGKYIAIIGLDGSGKTEIITTLMKGSSNNNRKTAYVWFRFAHLTSLIILLLARVTNATRKVNGQLIHAFRGHKSIAFLYPRFLYVDMRITNFWKIRVPLSRGWILYLDRCPYDAVVDTAFDLGNRDFVDSILAERYCDLLPTGNGIVIFLDVKPDTVRVRRPELMHDSTLEERYRLYKLLVKRWSIPIVSNEGSITETICELKKLIRGIEE